MAELKNFKSETFEQGFGHSVRDCYIEQKDGKFFLCVSSAYYIYEHEKKEHKVEKTVELKTIASAGPFVYFEAVESSPTDTQFFIINTKTGHATNVDRVDVLRDGSVIEESTWWQSRSGYDDAGETSYWLIDKDGKETDLHSSSAAYSRKSWDETIYGSTLLYDDAKMSAFLTKPDKDGKQEVFFFDKKHQDYGYPEIEPTAFSSLVLSENSSPELLKYGIAVYNLHDNTSSMISSRRFGLYSISAGKRLGNELVVTLPEKTDPKARNYNSECAPLLPKNFNTWDFVAECLEANPTDIALLPPEIAYSPHWKQLKEAANRGLKRLAAEIGVEPKEPVAPKEPVEPEKPEELTSLPKNAIGKALYVRSKKYKTAAAKYEKDMDAYEHAKAKYSDDYFKYSGELRFFKQDKEKYDKKLAEFLKEKETVDKALNGIEAAKTK